MLFDASKTVETRRDEAGRARARGVVEGGAVEQRTTREEDDARRGRRAKRTTREEDDALRCDFINRDCTYKKVELRRVVGADGRRLVFVSPPRRCDPEWR